MTDTLQIPEEPAGDGTGEDNVPEEKPGLAFYAAFALVGLLVIIVLFANVQGTRASAAVEITRPSWVLESYADSAGTLIPAFPGTRITARFGTAGMVTGTAGCNSYSASYRVKDYGIAVSSLINTEMSCSSPDIIQQEAAYLGDLPNSSIFRFSEKRLNIYDAAGRPVLVFVSV